MDDGFKAVFGILAILIGLLALVSNNNIADDELKACEAKGGTLLRNTYKVGKQNKVERLCVSSEFILNDKAK